MLQCIVLPEDGLRRLLAELKDTRVAASSSNCVAIAGLLGPELIV